MDRNNLLFYQYKKFIFRYIIINQRQKVLKQRQTIHMNHLRLSSLFIENVYLCLFMIPFLFSLLYVCFFVLQVFENSKKKKKKKQDDKAKYQY